jgi:molybdopterin converting factor subunit 1
MPGHAPGRAARRVVWHPEGFLMPHVCVLYFGGLREALGCAEERLELSDGISTVGALCAHLATKHSAYAARKAHVRVARNEAFASDEERLADGDVVALIPPVAGG